jgi:hypothetical protein
MRWLFPKDGGKDGFWAPFIMKKDLQQTGSK